MLLKGFNDAIEAAQIAFAAGNEAAFVSAVTAAQSIVQAHPPLYVMLSRAVEAFPDMEAIMLISKACLYFAEVAG